ncbi:GntR family transcriptional regulator [Streptomyces sp. NPDC092369]|uniref:GntR family transcriptional regulator n=1 Tax=Streptomyces sp. NPDC092369 TaxID=3366015 RepID=UPI00380D308F
MYRKVAADLGREIGEGGYGSGGRLPTEGELAERYGVSRGTVRQAMALPRAEGLIASRAAPGGSSRGRSRRSPPAPAPVPRGTARLAAGRSPVRGRIRAPAPW